MTDPTPADPGAEPRSTVNVEKTPEERHQENLRKAEQAGALAPAIDGSGDEGLTRDETGRVVATEGPDRAETASVPQNQTGYESERGSSSR